MPTPKKLLVFSIFLMILSGCGKTVFPTHTNTIAMNDPIDLNGVYRDVSSDSSVANNRLWNVLTKRPGPHGYKSKPYPSDSRTIITKKNAHRLLVEIVNDSVRLNKKILKGSMDGNAFRINERTHYFGLPFLIMTLSHYQLQISKDDKGQLLLDVADAHGGMVLIFTGGSTNTYEFIYERITTDRRNRK